MMEVKQNTPMDFNDLMSSNTEMNDRNDDIMTDLQSSELKSGLLDTNELARNGLLSGVTNGSSSFNNVASIDLDIDSDLGEPVSPELEEALLAEEGANVVDKLLAEAVPKAANILENKADVLSTVNNLDTIRNPADDFDKLLSKINEFENCIESARHETSQSDCNNEENSVVEIAQTSENSTTKDDKTEDITLETVVAKHTVDETNKTVETNAMPETVVDDSVRVEKDETAQEVKADRAEASVAAVMQETNAVEQATNVSKDVTDCVELSKNVKEILNAKPEVAENKSNISMLTLDDDDDDEVMKAVETKENEIKSVAAKDVMPAKLDAEDSDDDIIFFEDKPVDSKLKASTEEKEDDSQKATVAEIKEKPTAIAEETDDDVVLLDDDDDEVIEQKTSDQVESTEIKKSTASAVEAQKEENELTTQTLENKENKDTVPKAAAIAAEIEKEEEKLEVKADASPIVEETKADSTAKTEIEVEANKKEAAISIDNSDNARDDFAADKGVEVEKETAKPKSDAADETNSNCSSSSNLLQETQAASDAGEEAEAEAEAEAEIEEEDEVEADADDIEGDGDGDGDGDLELGEDVITVGEETKDSESAPPTKRIRLSADENDEPKPAETEESRSSSKFDDMVQTENSKVDEEVTLNEDKQLVMEKEVTNVAASVKRTYDVLNQSEIEKHDEEVEEVVIKKAKIEESDVKEPTTEVATITEEETSDSAEVTTDIKLDASEAGEEQSEKSTDIKETPLEVYSVPEIKAVPSDIPVPLYPPPKFEDSVPSLSLDFLKRFRKTFDKMTKNDLEELVLQKVVEAIVHKSEFAEMREIIEKQEKIIVSHRNKICELTKQFRDLEMVHNRVVKDIETKNSQFLMPVKITRAVGLQVYIPNKRNNEPVINSPIALSTQSPSTSSVPQSQTRNTPLQPTSTSPRAQGSGDLRSNNSALASAAAAAAANSRRGCVQKVTPQRPVDGGISNNNSNAMLNTTQVSPGVYRSGNVLLSALAQGAQTPQQNALRVLNKGVAMRNRYSGPTPTELQRQQQLQQQQQLARQQAQNGSQRKLMPKASPTSTHMITQQQQYRRAEGSTPGVDIPLTPQVPAGVSITPAKPKEKAVIDLTDEDEQQTLGGTQVRRLPAQAASNVNISTQYLNNRAVPPLTRMPTATQVSNKTQTTARQQLASMQANSKTNSVLSHISTPPGTSITRVHIAPTSNLVGQRTKYGHPAPLPITPPQTYNPAWKLPPPRPTIRISNLDNGIVISWTMEETMERHAECVSYQIYAYQETSAPPMVDSWRHVGDVKAMLLPMAVTLTQFQEGQRYYFAVRAVDIHQRFGPFSLPKTWT